MDKDYNRYSEIENDEELTNDFIEDDIEEDDMDCFFRIGDTAYHFASNGYEIPDFISREKNLSILRAIEDNDDYPSSDTTGVIVRKENIKSIISREFPDTENLYKIINPGYSIDEMVNDYAASFKEMAALGFVSMDLTEDGEFYVIAKPAKNVPGYILDMLPVVDETIKDKIKE